MDVERGATEEFGRRSFLRYVTMAAGSLGLTALAAACGGNKSVTTEGSVATTTGPATTAGSATTATPATTTAAATTAAKTATSAPAAVSTAAPVATGASAGAAGAFPAAHEVAIAFSYVADAAAMGNMPAGGGKGGGRINNPYVAVWIEGADGALVKNLSVTYQIGRGDRWLNELQRWFGKTGGKGIETISSATRVPGDYKIVWDGTSDAKQPVAQGNYFFCIEASREHGPHELVREQVAVGAAPFSKALADNGELQKVTVELRARG